MKRKTKIIVGVASAVVLGVLGFFGYKYKQYKKWY